MMRNSNPTAGCHWSCRRPPFRNRLTLDPLHRHSTHATNSNCSVGQSPAPDKGRTFAALRRRAAVGNPSPSTPHPERPDAPTDLFRESVNPLEPSFRGWQRMNLISRPGASSVLHLCWPCLSCLFCSSRRPGPRLMTTSGSRICSVGQLLNLMCEHLHMRILCLRFWASRFLVFTLPTSPLPPALADQTQRRTS